MALRKFCCTPFTDKSETLLSFLATFDVVVTDAVDSFKFIVKELKAGDRYIGEDELEEGQDVRRRSEQYSETFSRFGKGGVMPHEIASRLKSFYQ